MELMQESFIHNMIKMQCGVCHFFARDSEDLEKIEAEGCCTECYNNFRFIYGKSWDKGKRPTIDEARAKMYIY